MAFDKMWFQGEEPPATLQVIELGMKKEDPMIVGSILKSLGRDRSSEFIYGRNKYELSSNILHELLDAMNVDHTFGWDYQPKWTPNQSKISYVLSEDCKANPNSSKVLIKLLAKEDKGLPFSEMVYGEPVGEGALTLQLYLRPVCRLCNEKSFVKHPLKIIKEELICNIVEMYLSEPAVKKVLEKYDFKRIRSPFEKTEGAYFLSEPSVQKEILKL